VAVKIVNDDDFMGTEAVHELEREVHYLRTLRHRNIVLMFGTGTYQQRLMLVTEYLARGSLREVLDDRAVRARCTCCD
jgi:serine/threonine protein kinase